MKTQRDYEIGPDDRAWIEATSEPVHPALAAIEEAAEPGNIPILDRESGRVLAVLASGRRRICEVGTAIGYSTLWMALAQGAGGSIVTIDPDRERTDLARGFWRSAPASRSGGSPWSTRRPSRRSPGTIRPSPVPFDLVFIDAIKGEYVAYLEALVPRLVPGAYVIADNVLWSGGCRGRGRPARTTKGRPRSESSTRPCSTTIASRHRSCRWAMVSLSQPTAAEPRTPTVHVRVRLFAIQRELAGTREVILQLPPGASIETAWTALVQLHPLLAPGRSAVRFALNGAYADATDLARRTATSWPASRRSEWRRDLAPNHGAARADPGHRLRKPLLGELADRLGHAADGAVAAFLGRTRETPGTPAPGQEAEALRHAGRAVDALEYEAHETMALAVLGAIADEVAERFGVERLAIVHRVGAVPLGDASIAVVAVSPHRDAAFQAARYAIDETKARAPIWKAERFEDGHVWVGAPA